MNWVGVLLLILHVIACSGLILIVLLQAGKGASLGAAFGAGASATVFGTRSATFIGRITWVLAGLFMLTSVLLTIISPWGEQGTQTGTAILQQEPVAPTPAEKTGQPILPTTSPLPESGQGETGEAGAGGVAPVVLPAETETPPEPGAPHPQPGPER